MATPIPLPALSPTMKEGKILKWLKNEGDKVSSGEAIAEVETDKSNLEVEAYDDGVLLKIVVAAGEMAAVGAPIAVLGAKGETVDLASLAPATPAAVPAPPAGAPRPAESPAAAPPRAAAPPALPAAPARAPAPVVPLRPPAAAGGDGRLRASPLARKMAQEAGVDLGAVHGSGPRGRIVKRDVQAAMSGPRAPVFVPGVRPEPDIVPLSSMRKVIAQRMAEVKPGVPHFYLSIEVDMEAVVAVREEAKAAEVKVSVNDFILKAAALALHRVPKVNVSLQGDRILQFHTADVGIAVAIEDGLITPVVRDADQKSIGQLAAEARELAERARRKALRPEEYSGGSVTVSNLGMYGVDAFIAVINPPQASILAVGTVAERVVARGGQPVVRKTMTMTFSGDHRVVDGALGAQYLQEVKELLEHPVRLLF
ncbi:MAG TPA: dihydrolipoamide acetyltransferase family protein [Myxococcaceae bacterium]|jgi:pyruvate dehydrogenase E2 component (dihydrolipoamide acetyltransferase)|nr:dihydrolipoamide acetyltransferase family protein [Myxococcaceae bacterium]